MPSDHSGSHLPTQRGRSRRPSPVRFISDAASRIARQLHAHLTSDDIVLFIKAAQPDDYLVYHVGFLANQIGDPRVMEKAYLVRTLQSVGVATILQKRLSENHYQYLLIKRNMTPEFPILVDKAMSQLRDKQRRHSRTG